MSIVVASIPSGHVYVRHLSDPADDSGQGAAVVRLPDPMDGAASDSPWWPPRMLTAAWIDEHADTFALMHLHFGFDALSPADLTEVVSALRHHGKPLVLTVHDLRNPHHVTSDIHDAQLAVLVPAAHTLITLTPGAAAVIRARWGREALVLPHPHVAPAHWLERPRPAREKFIIGIHVKSLRANMDPLPLVDAAVEAVPDLPGAVVTVDAHRDVMNPEFDRYDPAVSQRLTTLAASGHIELNVHNFFTDEELFAYLHGLDVSVLPYRFGTHSGWLEACHDVGTRAIVPDCGFYAEQRPCFTYAADGPGRELTFVLALRRAHADRLAPRANAADRLAERVGLAQAHERIYAAALRRSLKCTS